MIYFFSRVLMISGLVMSLSQCGKKSSIVAPEDVPTTYPHAYPSQ